MSNRSLTRRSRAGFTLIELLVVVALLAVLSVMASPRLLSARRAAQETSAISSLRTFVTAQERHRTRTGQFASSLTDLIGSGTVDPVLASGLKSGYRFENPTAVGGITFSLQANPEVPGHSGERYFFVNETGVIRFRSTGPAGPGDTPVN